MEKDKIYDELAKVSAEVNKLRDECRAKTDLSDGLRTAHVDQQAKIHLAKLEIKKLAQELNAKSDEIRDIRQTCEELQSSLHRKEIFLQQTSFSIEKLQAEHKEKILVLERGNKDLSVALDVATARIHDLERKSSVSDEEIATLKRIFSVKSEKDIEMQRNASKDLKDTEEYMLSLEEETSIVKDQLKWKREQFSHLEEAHDKLRTQFQASAVKWQKEKSSLITELSKLQAALDDKNRISEGHQVLADEKRRKILEIKLSESRIQFENDFLDCQESQSEIERITVKRDEEFADICYLLGKKDKLANEMRYGSVRIEEEKSNQLECFRDAEAAKLDNSCATSSLKRVKDTLQGLEQLHNKCVSNLKEKDVECGSVQLKEEKKDLLVSFRDAEANSCAAYSLKRMQDKLQGLEQWHSKCTSNLKEKDSEWNHQIGKLKEDLICSLSELDGKNKSLGEIQKELEDCRFLLEVKNEEIFALLMVLKSEFCVSFSKMCDENMKLGMSMKQAEEKNMLLKQQLELRNTDLNHIHAEVKQRWDEIAALKAKVEPLDSLKQEKNLVDEELKRYKKMLDELNKCQCCLKEQCLTLENTLIENRKHASNALEMANSELTNKTSELYKSKLDLGKWKIEADTLKLKLEEYKLAHKQDIEERKQMIFNLEKEVIDLRSAVECEEKKFFVSKQETLELKCLLQSKILEMEELKGQFGNERRSFEGLLEDLKKASIGKEDSLSQLKDICGGLGVLCRDNMKLMDMLETILQSSEDNGRRTLDLLASGGLDDTTFSPSRKLFRSTFDGRFPLTELNF